MLGDCTSVGAARDVQRSPRPRRRIAVCGAYGANSHLSPYVFTSERGGPIAAKSFHTLISRLGERAGMAFPIHPHMLRHGCGYALANAGHDTRAIQAWMGHKNIQHTVRYTELAPDRFKDFWRD
jgi:site-specific recombinase XerD